jgi:beta-1,4-mannosyltransferase
MNPHSAHPLRVLLSVRRPGTRDNPYTTLLVDALRKQAGVEVEYFTWKRAIIGSYDVLHIQWPESLLRGRNALRRVAALIFCTILLVRLRVFRTPVVRTAHNLVPHERGSLIERRFLERLDASTSMWITLNAHTPVPRGASRALIPHGHYRDWYTASPRSERDRNVLYFGLIRSYKGVDQLLHAFSEISAPSFRLRVLGMPSSDDEGARLAAHIQAAADVDSTLEHIPDDELAEAISDSELVVLPYRNLHNSGSALLALSLNTPVLVPANDVTRDLQEEFGADHVHLFTGELTGHSLFEAFSRAHDRGGRQAVLPMDGRNWDVIAAAHAQVYRSVLDKQLAKRTR